MGYPNTCPDCNGHFNPGHSCPPPPKHDCGYALRAALRIAEKQLKEVSKLKKKLAKAQTLRVNDILELQRVRDELLRDWVSHGTGCGYGGKYLQVDGCDCGLIPYLNSVGLKEEEY